MAKNRLFHRLSCLFTGGCGLSPHSAKTPLLCVSAVQKTSQEFRLIEDRETFFEPQRNEAAKIAQRDGSCYITCSMKIVPLFKVTGMREAIRHYTEVLDFVFTCAEDTADSPVIDLGHEETELQLTIYESDRLFGSVANVFVNDVDSLFTKYRNRGLDLTANPNSPVHQAPTNQTWGRREFYVTDRDGNTLRFWQPIL